MGAFFYEFSPGSAARLLLSGSGIVPRSLSLNGSDWGGVTVDAISRTGFDLDFYRQLVRNTSDAPDKLEPLRRWTKAPSIYLKTVDEAGAAIDVTTLDMIDLIARDMLPRWTAGRFDVATIERGAGTRVGVSGWITIQFPTSPPAGVCGTAQVGFEGGKIELEYHDRQCRCSSTSIAPRTVRHELGHALGFFHTATSTDLMFGGKWSTAQCDLQPATRELAVAAIAYSRPVGNTDPDSDPSFSVNLAPMTVR
jgi:hypothetical protein